MGYYCRLALCRFLAALGQGDIICVLVGRCGSASGSQRRLRCAHYAAQPSTSIVILPFRKLADCGLEQDQIVAPFDHRVLGLALAIANDGRDFILGHWSPLIDIATLADLRHRQPVATNAEDGAVVANARSEEHTSELQSHSDLVCRLLLEK